MSVLKVSYASMSLFRTVNLEVILPVESYGDKVQAAQKPKFFKTLYLLNGFGGNQEDWLDYSLLRNLAEKNNLAIVLPAGENSFYEDQAGTGGQHGELVGKELVEFTRRILPLSTNREDTYIGGLSMGGFGALLLGSKYYRTFSKIFSLSGAFIIDDIANQGASYTDQIADYSFYKRTFGDLSKVRDSEKDPLFWVKKECAAGIIPNFYQAVGKNDFLIEENRTMHAKLTNLKVNLTYNEDKGIHDWNFWNAYLPKAINWLLA